MEVLKDRFTSPEQLFAQIKALLDDNHSGPLVNKLMEQLQKTRMEKNYQKLVEGLIKRWKEGKSQDHE